MTDSTQRELRMLANRMLTQTEARNGYQGSPVCLLLRKDAEKAMALMTKAADLVDVLESSLRLQAEVAADANAQANAMRRLLDEERAQEPIGEYRFNPSAGDIGIRWIVKSLPHGLGYEFTHLPEIDAAIATQEKVQRPAGGAA